MNRYILGDFTNYLRDKLYVSDDQIASTADLLIKKYCVIRTKYLRLDVIKIDLGLIIWEILEKLINMGSFRKDKTSSQVMEYIYDYYTETGQMHPIDTLINEAFGIIKCGASYRGDYEDDRLTDEVSHHIFQLVPNLFKKPHLAKKIPIVYSDSSESEE